MPPHPADLPTNQASLKQFPSARYFQVHFEFLQEQLQQMLRMQETMREQIAQLEGRLLDKPPLRLNEHHMTDIETDQVLLRRDPKKNQVGH